MLLFSQQNFVWYFKHFPRSFTKFCIFKDFSSALEIDISIESLFKEFKGLQESCNIPAMQVAFCVQKFNDLGYIAYISCSYIAVQGFCIAILWPFNLAFSFWAWFLYNWPLGPVVQSWVRARPRLNLLQYLNLCICVCRLLSKFQRRKCALIQIIFLRKYF